MTEPIPDPSAAHLVSTRGDTEVRQTVAPRSTTTVPLWVAAISLAVIAAVMIIGSIELLHALKTTQASVVQLQQQVQRLKDGLSGLGGLMGG